MNKFKFLFDTLYRDPLSINLNLHLSSYQNSGIILPRLLLFDSHRLVSTQEYAIYKNLYSKTIHLVYYQLRSRHLVNIQVCNLHACY